MFVISCDYISPTCIRMASSIPCCQGECPQQRGN